MFLMFLVLTFEYWNLGILSPAISLNMSPLLNCAKCPSMLC
jgi:hypothetical protein